MMTELLALTSVTWSGTYEMLLSLVILYYHYRSNPVLNSHSPGLKFTFSVKTHPLCIIYVHDC